MGGVEAAPAVGRGGVDTVQADLVEYRWWWGRPAPFIFDDRPTHRLDLQQKGYAINNNVTMKNIADNAYDTLRNYIEKDVVLHKDVISDYFDKMND